MGLGEAPDWWGNLMYFQMIAVAIGGAFGALLRFLTVGFINQFAGNSFPWGTMTVNVVGSFLIGFLSIVALEVMAWSPEWRSLIFAGFLGGLTTFSSFSLETFLLLSNGQLGRAGFNVLANVLLCLSATWLGILLAKQI